MWRTVADRRRDAGRFILLFLFLLFSVGVIAVLGLDWRVVGGSRARRERHIGAKAAHEVADAAPVVGPHRVGHSTARARVRDLPHHHPRQPRRLLFVFCLLLVRLLVLDRQSQLMFFVCFFLFFFDGDGVLGLGLDCGVEVGAPRAETVATPASA